jgi:endoglucanase
MPDSNGRKERALQLLMRFGEAHGAPGREDAVRRIFREELQNDLRTDSTGNIFCERKGRAETPRIMVAAHMDEVAFMVQAITKSGLIKFVPLGGWWPHTMLAHRVKVLTRDGTEIVGVIGAKPPHFLTESEREKVMKPDDMFIDVGAVSADDVRNRFGIRLGDGIVPESSFTPMHNPDYLLCKAFDDRSGMALMTHTMEMLSDASHPNIIYGVGTVQEEMGVRGAKTAPASVNPDLAIVLEGTPADDLPMVPEDERQGALCRGVQIRIMDASAIMNIKFARYAMATAEEHGIKYQAAVRRSGGTDAGAIHLYGAGVPTIVLGVPARYIHTHNTIIHIDDYLSALDLVLALIQGLDAATASGITKFE